MSPFVIQCTAGGYTAYGLAEGRGGGSDELIFNIGGRAGAGGAVESLVHEIGHLAAITHHGDNDHIMQDGIPRNRGTANLLNEDDADKFSGH